MIYTYIENRSINSLSLQR